MIVSLEILNASIKGFADDILVQVNKEVVELNIELAEILFRY